jgi:hypothetical protein
MSPNRVRAALASLALLGLLAAARAAARVPAFEDVAAARAFLASLDGAQRTRTRLDFDDPARLDWHFVPRARPGVMLGELGPEAEAALRALLAAGLSARGVERVDGVIALERLLRERESRPGRPAEWRDPGLYAVTVFGEPHEREPWSWRLEGHHLSLVFTRAGEALSVTPAFVGANPARAEGGPGSDGRLLGVEEDLARALVRSLSPEQLAAARVAEHAPPDLLYGPARAARLEAREGIAGLGLDALQRATLERLVDAWLAGWPAETAATARERLGPIEDLRFTWMGGLEAGDAHYWRIDGAHALIEWDDVQDGANHVHCVWRDLGRDHGADLLGGHARREHAQPPSDGSGGG